MHGSSIFYSRNLSWELAHASFPLSHAGSLVTSLPAASPSKQPLCPKLCDSSLRGGTARYSGNAVQKVETLAAKLQVCRVFVRGEITMQW
jgi:hypothetical protein